MAALHRLDVAAELLAVGVHEESSALRQNVTQKGLCAVVNKALCDPFIPAGNKDKLRIHLQRVPPLFAKVQAERGLRFAGCRLFPTGKAAPDIGYRMFGYRHGHLLGALRRLVPTEVLRRVVEPRPFVLAIAKPALGVGPRPGMADRKEVGRGRGKIVRR